MSDTGLTVPRMTELPRRYDVTITVNRDDGHLPGPGRVRRDGRAGGMRQGRQHHERANAQLETWRILRKLRCCPWRAGQLAKAIHVLQAREA